MSPFDTRAFSIMAYKRQSRTTTHGCHFSLNDLEVLIYDPAKIININMLEPLTRDEDARTLLAGKIATGKANKFHASMPTKSVNKLRPELTAPGGKIRSFTEWCSVPALQRAARECASLPPQCNNIFSRSSFST